MKSSIFTSHISDSSGVFGAPGAAGSAGGTGGASATGDGGAGSTRPMRTPALSKRAWATRERLLRAAETLFAEKGCHATSVRDLAAKAGVNLAAVCYHFGSKERLLVEALARQIRPLNVRRIAALDAVLSVGPQPQLKFVLDAFARTFVEEALAPGDRGRRLHRLISRAFAEADEVAEACFREELLPTAKRFLDAIHKARPELSRGQAALGLAFYAGSTVHILRWIAQPLLPGMPTRKGPDQGEMLLQSLVGYGVAGFDSLGKGGQVKGRRKRGGRMLP